MEPLFMKERNATPHAANSALTQEALERWDTEGGGILQVPPPRPAKMREATHPRKKPVDSEETKRVIELCPAS